MLRFVASPRVEVDPHAVERFRQRCRDERSRPELGRQIEDEVRLAIAEGRRSERKPESFRLYKERSKGRLLPGFECCWSDDSRRAWVVRRQGAGWRVVTTLTRSGVAERDEAA